MHLALKRAECFHYDAFTVGSSTHVWLSLEDQNRASAPCNLGSVSAEAAEWDQSWGLQAFRKETDGSVFFPIFWLFPFSSVAFMFVQEPFTQGMVELLSPSYIWGLLAPLWFHGFLEPGCKKFLEKLHYVLLLFSSLSWVRVRIQVPPLRSGNTEGCCLKC